LGAARCELAPIRSQNALQTAANWSEDRPMKKRLLLIAAATSLALVQGLVWAAQGSSTPGGSGKKSYKWVDDKGATHYGDMVPPEYSSQGRSELNGQGVELRQYPRQLTPTEAVDAQKAAAEKARLRQHDSFLLTTYTKVSDIEQLRDERLALIDGQMDIARGSIESTTQKLGGLEQRMRSFKPYSTSASARRVPDKLAEEVVRALKEKGSLQTALTSREAEKAGLRAQFEADITRYRELTVPRQPR
jgi:hypothetical protein